MTLGAIITATSTVRRNTDVMAHPLDDDLVMADLESGHYFGLSGTGKRIWELLAQPAAVASIAATLTREYAVEPPACERDLLEFLNDLRAAGLLLVVT